MLARSLGTTLSLWCKMFSQTLGVSGILGAASGACVISDEPNQNAGRLRRSGGNYDSDT